MWNIDITPANTDDSQYHSVRRPDLVRSPRTVLTRGQRAVLVV